MRRVEIEPLDARAARVAALDALARRDHGSAGLRRKLVEKGYDPGVVDQVLARLTSEKLLDDRRYVESFVAYHAARGQGPLRVRAELQKVGMKGSLVEESLAAYPDWLAQLRQAATKKFGVMPATDYADRQRRGKFLGYRGYTGAQIRAGLGIDTDVGFDSEAQ